MSEPLSTAAPVQADEAASVLHGLSVDPIPLGRALEGLLTVLDGPLRPVDVAKAWRVEEAAVIDALRELRARCETEDRGHRVRLTGSGWRLYAADDLQRLLRTAVVGDTTARLSAAAMETLAVVAYQQPVSRSRIAAIRGVNVDAVVRTLSARGLVVDSGQDPVTGAVLYGTTELFLDLLGLHSLEQLPELAPLLPEISSISDMTS